VDYLAGILELLGVLLVGNLRRHGFLLCIACNALWIIVALRSGVYGLIPVSAAMAVVNTRNFRRWKRMEPA
jgi:hypothetical protein